MGTMDAIATLPRSGGELPRYRRWRVSMPPKRCKFTAATAIRTSSPSNGITATRKSPKSTRGRAKFNRSSSRVRCSAASTERPRGALRASLPAECGRCGVRALPDACGPRAGGRYELPGDRRGSPSAGYARPRALRARPQQDRCGDRKRTCLRFTTATARRRGELTRTDPRNISPERWRETLANIVALDVAAIAGLATGSPTTLTTAPGLHEILLRLHVDGTLQPAALYIPVGFRADERVPLAIVLHGRPQSESELLGPFVLRDLADASRTILLAPYGHGNYDFAEPAATDVYDAAAAVGNALPVDARRTYLVG